MTPTTLNEMKKTHERTQKVRVLYNGECVFRGVVGALDKFIDPQFMDRPANLYTGGLCHDDFVDVFLQVRA